MHLLRGNSRGGRLGHGMGDSNRATALLSSVADPHMMRGDEWLIDLEQLEIDEEIGSGVSAQVFRGTYYGQEVAVKRLFSSLWEQDKFDEFFKAEAKMLKSLNHPNVVRFFGAAFDTTTEHGFLVTEYCTKGSLTKLIKERRPEVGRDCFFSLMGGVARGMEFFHGRGFVHRDLKPDNVLLGSGDIAKLCDFGLSRVAARDQTVMTAGVGTPAYMAVELITEAVKSSNRVDVYSMGVLMWALWTHEVPYGEHELTPFMLMTKLVGGMRPTIPAEMPPALVALVEQCWQDQPEQRPTFTEICEKLATIEAAESAPVAAPMLATTPMLAAAAAAATT